MAEFLIEGKDAELQRCELQRAAFLGVGGHNAEMTKLNNFGNKDWDILFFCGHSYSQEMEK